MMCLISVSAKMFLKCLFLSLVSLLSEVVSLISMEVCDTKNVSCTGIKDTAGNYHFRFQTPNATTEIEINENETPLVLGKFGSLKISPDVLHCDNEQIIRHTCRNLSVKFIEEKGGKISESCLIFNIIEDTMDVLSSPGWTTGKIVAVVLALLIVVTCAAIGWYWWKKRRGNGCGFPVGGFGRRGLYVTQRRNADQSAADDNRLNSQQEQEENLLNRKSDSRDSNGMVIIPNIDDMTRTNDDKDVPQGIRAFPHVGQNGNTWHDPGGGKADTKLHGNKKCLNGGTLGEQSPDRDKDEEQHSPRSQGSGRPGYLARGEGGELVHSRGSGSDKSTSPGEEKEATLED